MIMSCRTPLGSPKRLLNPNSSPKTPVTKGSSPSSSKNCLVCGINLRIESFYALSRPVLLSALNAILQTTVQFPLEKDDQRRVGKSCFRRLELIKNKKAYWKHYRKNFKRSTTAQYSRIVKPHPTSNEATCKRQPARSRYEKDLCHLKFRCK